MWKNKYLKVMGFSNILGEAEIIANPKTYKKWITIVWEKYGEKQTFQIYGFIKYFEWSRNLYLQFPKYGKSEFP